MRISYPLLIGAAAAVWGAGRFAAPVPAMPHAAPPAFGMAGSAYGSLVARLMRDSLYAYWHGGEQTRNHQPAAVAPGATSQTPPPPAMPGRLARRGQPPMPPPPSAPASVVETPEEASGSVLDRGVKLIARLDAARTRRDGPLALSAAHSRYLNAAADWRLRLACQLDPGDAVLYEILHFQIQSRAGSPEAALKASEELAQRALQHALSDDSGLGDCLTGAGAAINLLNASLQPGQTDLAAASRTWQNLDTCLDRYRQLRSHAQNEGWWAAIPEIRREELENHARFLETLAGRIRRQLSRTGVLSQAGSR
ncbi:hypothetical protein [Verrucomicrobium spinosum]|uniref:hypothetical protein n=1 Tax=Verrucomicrobium spinosum TaxID=2736 RepID=UPI0001744D68|nr:hypothetical protein [Verrucomicrobium spinosum]